MAVEDEQLASLIEAVSTTGRRHIALGLANTLKAANSVARLSTAERAEAATVEAEWVSASAALTRYHASHF